MTRRRATVAALAGAVAIAPLQGCLLTRVMATRAQLCDEQPAQVVVATAPGRGLRVVFEKPTLTEQDVIWIVGFEPSARIGTDAAREFVYEARTVQTPWDASAGLVARLSFVRTDAESRLAAIEIPEKFNTLLPPKLLEAGVKVACQAQIAVAPPRTTFDLSDVDRAALPTRTVLGRLLGPPDTLDAGRRELAYRYCLVPCEASRATVANLDFRFDGEGRVEHATASYFRYRATLDLVSPRPVAIVELVSPSLSIGTAKAD